MTPEEQEVLSYPDGTFIYAWQNMTSEQRSAIGPNGFERYRKLIPLGATGATIHRLDQPRKKPNGDGSHKDRPAFDLEPDESPKVQRGTPLNWSDLAARGDPPSRQWAINGWIGFGHVSLLIGGGGIGKTLISQQIASCLATGALHFLSEIPRSLTTMMWCCEDDHDEMWRRQMKIATWQGVGLEQYTGGLIIEPRLGLDNALFSSVMGQPVVTPLMAELTEQAGDYRADVVILDNIAQLYGANENDRHCVTTFINKLVGALPGRAILLLGHPSRGEGSEFSGSSAWENCARTRLYFGDRLPDAKPGDAEPETDIRYISRRKSNYSSKDYRRLTFNDGAYVQDAEEVGDSQLILGIKAQKPHRVILDAARRLREIGVRFTDGTTSPQFMPKMILEYKLGEGCTKRELSDAMRQAILNGKLVRGEVGQYQNRSPMFGLMCAEDEKKSQ